MPRTQLSLVLRYLRRVLGTPASGDVPDADLLTRFVTGRDEAAFELLLWRHGAMVLRVCRDVTRDEHTAEDAFQATFLTLVRQAAAIRDRQSLGAWLYQVAYRVAVRARSQAVRRAARERHDLDLHKLAATAELPEETALHELRPLLHEELQRLPPKYRLPIVLCYFEGLTHEEAAQQLGWPKGTVSGRLSRARDLLRKRLARRGVTWPVALTALAHAPAPASALVPAALGQTTLRTALLIATGQAVAGTIPAQVAALTEGVLHAMFWNKVKLAAATVLALGLVGGGVGLVASGRLITPSAAPETQAVAGQERAGGEAEPADPKPAQKVDKQSAAEPRALAAARNQTMQNLHEIGLAMHNYHSANGSFPPSADGKDGRPLLSWRVALLPYLGQGDLYRQFHLDEPWDSPHNKKLLANRPKVYHHPGDTDETTAYYQQRPAQKLKPRHRCPIFKGNRGLNCTDVQHGLASERVVDYQVFVGQGTIFEERRGEADGGMAPGEGGPPGSFGTAGGEAARGAVARKPAGIRMNEISDGTSNTLLVIEAGSPVPWTKPEDLAYAALGKIPPLGGAFPDVIYAALADGQVVALKRKYDERILRACITRNGGEVEGPDLLIDPAPGADASELKQYNERLRRELDEARTEVVRLQQQLLEHQLAAPGEVKEGTVTDRLKEERRLLQQQLDRARAEAKRLRDQIQRLQRGESEGETKKK